ncbi:YhdP family phospholipid transporter [Halomonas garicola]|uniref:YhdP family phospholipid transporter n=1 Tax=Halomonas garicola TaxID=1690008 RepID=UPI002897B649|nr:AsmA-like C-terminal region-containing protein [Halomonas garicola]
MTLPTLRKGCLLVLAWCLGTLAVLLLVLRLLASQADALTPHLEAFLQSHFGAPVNIESLSLAVERDGLRLDLRGVEAELPDAPLFSLGALRLRLDVGRSLRALAPVFRQTRMEGFSLHLYRGEGAGWGWPEPATLPLYLAPDTEVDLDTVDAWTRLVLHQRLQITDTRLLMHGNDGSATVHAPRLVLSGSDKRIRMAGEVAVASSLLSEAPTDLPAASLKADVRPGSAGLKDYSAALQLDMQLEQLSALAELVRPDFAPQLALSGGESTFWGRWQAGRLEDVRLQFNLPELKLTQADKQVVLKGLEALGQWRRDGDGGNAWLSGDVADAERVATSGSKAPTLPRHWQLTHQQSDWELRTSAFELDSLAAWSDYVVLPESLTRPLAALAPEGTVSGLQVGQQGGEWRVDAALHDLVVSPWDEAPGGGPLDAWVRARDQRGRVTFAGGDDTSLYFPQVFDQPMELGHAKGQVQWVHDGPSTLISGRQLEVVWNGARVTGEFGLANGGERQQMGLDLAFTDVDAVNTPLMAWLPVKVLGDDLKEWLADGVSGRVEQGSLQITAPLGENTSADDIETTLALDITQGALPIAEGWPTLSDVEGRLELDRERLEASVARAESHGVRATDGEVELDVASGELGITGDLAAEADALRAFFLAAPALEAESLLEDVRARGDARGELDIRLDLDDPESLALDVHVKPRFERLAYAPIGTGLSQLEGDITWRQRGREGDLLGEAQADLPGGDIRADFTPGNVALDGSVNVAELLGAADLAPEAAAKLVGGSARWQGAIKLGDTPTLHLQSGLEGIGIKLPAPFAKAAGARLPWTLDADLGAGRVESRLGRMATLRARGVDGELAGQLNLGTRAARLPRWPSQSGWRIAVGAQEVEPLAWRELGSALSSRADDAGKGAGGLTAGGPLTLSLETPCVKYNGECLGSVTATGQRLAGGGVDLALDGSVLAGNLRYRPGDAEPIDITVDQLMVDRLLGLSSPDKISGDSVAPAPGSWMEAVETRVPAPAAMPDWLTELPAGRLRVADIVLGNKRFGPLTAYWQAGRHHFTLAPVGLTLGELSARGELVWQGSDHSSQTRADLTLDGGDLGTAFARLDQPLAIRSKSTRVAASLEWPGAPWQFALSRAGGSLSTDIRDGRFLTLDSPSARLVGLLNFENILRRLRLDFSDVTGKGTAFNRVKGKADVAGGVLRLRGPLTIDAPATSMRLTGSVDLLQRELDQRLGVTLPISQSLPIAAFVAGAPVVGGALFVAHTLFGDALERATTIHYRLEGPWASPDIILEGTQ